MTHSYLDAVDRCYAALEAGGDFDGLLADLGRWLGAAAGDVVREDVATGEVHAYGSFGFDPVFRDRYDTDFLGANPWAATLEARPGGRVHTDIEERHEVLASAYFNEWVRPQRLGRSLGARLPGRPGRTLWVGFAREAGAPVFAGEQAALVERLLPHLGRVIELSHRLEPRGGAPLAGMRAPAVLLAGDGRILSATPAAGALIDGTRLCRTRDDRLAPANPQDAQRFRKLLAAAISVMEPQAAPLPAGAMVCLAHDREGGVTALRFTPYSLTDPDLGTPRRAALVELRDWQAPGAPDLSALALAYGLTPTELDLIAHLASGEALDAFAEQRGMAVSTARWHLKNAESKTGTHRAEQLVALAFQRGFRRGQDPR